MKRLLFLLVSVLTCLVSAPDAFAATCSHNWKRESYELAHPHYYYQRCTKCNFTRRESSTYGKLSSCSTCNPPHTHSYSTRKSSLIIIDPSCTDAGDALDTMACSCGATTEVSRKIPAKGHNWSRAGYESAHPHYYYERCSRCSATRRESSTYSGKASGCTTCNPPHTHNYSTRKSSLIIIDPSCTDTGDALDTMACSCGATTEVSRKLPAKGHNWSRAGYESAHPHYYYERCSRCSATRRESSTYSGKASGCTTCNPPHTHSYSTRKSSLIIIDPSCTDTGDALDTMACSCGATTEVSRKIPAKGHNWSRAGYEAAHPHYYYERCSRCSATRRESSTYSGKASGCTTCNPPHTHSYSTRKSSLIIIDPSCTDTGDALDTMACSCGATTEVSRKLPAKGHSWIRAGSESAHPHYHYQKCSGCGATQREATTNAEKIATCERCYPAPTISLLQPAAQTNVAVDSPLTVAAKTENCHHCAVSVRYNNGAEKWLGELTPAADNTITLDFTPTEAGACVVTVYGRNTKTKDDPGSRDTSAAVALTVVAKPHTHSYTTPKSSVIILDRTCTEDGWALDTMACSCGTTDDVSRKLPASGHSWQRAGYEAAHPHHYYQKCSACGATQRETATYAGKLSGCGGCYAAPVVTLLKPADQTIAAVGSPVTIEASTADCHHCAVSVRYNNGAEQWLGEHATEGGKPMSCTFSPKEAGTCVVTVYGRNTPSRDDAGSAGASASATLTVLPKPHTPALSIGTVTDTSVAVSVTYPWPSTWGNKLILLDPVASKWVDFNDQPCDRAPYRTGGTYTQTGLRPDTWYRVFASWWDPMKNAYDQLPVMDVRTNPDPEDTAYCSGPGEKFLIIVANDLYQSANWRALTSAIHGYQRDLVREGWAPKVIRVSNVPDNSSRFVCPTPQALKDVIRSHYDEGYTGFVMIGSHPVLQAAWTRTEDNEKDHASDYYADPCDLYFADMDGVWTAKTVGRTTVHEQPEDWDMRRPEMFFGRIYLKGAVIRQPNGSYDTIDTAAKEAREIVRYLGKIHGYRADGGPSLTAAEEGSCFVYGRCDFDRNYKDELVDYSKRFSSILVNIEKSMSNEEDFLDTIATNGFQALLVDSHGWPEGFTYNDYLKFGEWNNRGVITSEKARTINAKVRTGILLPCSTARYCSFSASATNKQEDCLAKALMFNSDYMLNVFAAVAPTNLFSPGEYPELLASATSTCIGKAAHQYFTEENPYYLPTATLYGDPTLKLHQAKSSPSLLPILTNYYDNLEVQADAVLTLPLAIKDGDSKQVTIEASGFPDGTVVRRTAAVSGGMAHTSIQWTSQWMHSGSYYTIALRITDDQHNSFVERFRLYVSPLTNGMLTDNASGWTVTGSNYQTRPCSIAPFSDFVKGTEFKLDKGYAVISQDVVLEPYRTYKLVFHGVKDQADNPASVYINGEVSNVDNNDYQTHLYTWANALEFTTGRNATNTIEIRLGSADQRVSGLFALTCFRIVPIYWQDFDEHGEFDQYAFADDACKFHVGEAGEMCVHEPATEAKLAFSDREYSNFSCDYDIELLPGPTHSDAGVFFRASELAGGLDNYKGYYFGMNANADFIQIGKANHNYRELAARSMPLETGRIYHVRVEAVASTISIYIDDMTTPALTFEDTEADRAQYLTGMIGFRSYRTAVNFDNLVIDSVRDEFHF